MQTNSILFDVSTDELNTYGVSSSFIPYNTPQLAVESFICHSSEIRCICCLFDIYYNIISYEGSDNILFCVPLELSSLNSAYFTGKCVATIPKFLPDHCSFSAFWAQFFPHYIHSPSLFYVPLCIIHPKNQGSCDISAVYRKDLHHYIANDLFSSAITFYST